MREHELEPLVRAHLEAKGFRVWVDPDGKSYFDVVARRGEEIGLVELKVADWKKVYAQALRRRGFGDWVSVALPSERLARRILSLPASRVGARVGVWVVRSPGVEELRPAQRLLDPGAEGPFAEQRAGLMALLDLLEARQLPTDVGWEGLPGHRPGRRSTRDYRLEELVPETTEKPE